MFAALYTFEVIPGKEEDLIQSWTRLTELIYDYCGSLGSRLHVSQEPNLYVAYAQWPNKEFWEKDTPENFPEEGKKMRDLMKSCCVSFKTEYELTMVSDRLKPINL